MIKKHQAASIAKKKLFQNVIGRLFFLWIIFFEVAVIFLCFQGVINSLLLAISQLILIPAFCASYEYLNFAIVLEICGEDLTFYMMNNKVVTHKKNDLVLVKERNIHLGGLSFKFSDDSVIKTHNRVATPTIIMNGLIEDEGFLEYYFGEKYIKNSFTLEY